MFEFVHARIAWFAAALLIWSTHGALQDDTEAQAIKKAGRVEIHDEHVFVRPAVVAPPRLRDPFQLERPEGEPALAPADVDAGLAARAHAAFAWAREHTALLGALAVPLSPALLGAQAARRRLEPLVALPDAPAELGDPPSFRLQLEAVSRVDGTGSARLNGRAYRAGDLIPGLDELAPPRVEAIEGVTVYVMHRGRVLTLDLDASPTLQVGEAAVVEAPQPGEPRAAAAAAPTGERRLTPREKNRLMKAGKLK